MNLDRRELLKYATHLPALAWIPLLESCTKEAALPEGAPFSLWRLMRQALRASPDHLAYRAQALVANGDPELIFNFVRDEIRLRPWVVPTHAVQIQLAGHAGERGVLRSGMATAREKAELLKSLLEQAGHNAEIVDGQIDFDAIGGKDWLLNQPPSIFAPDDNLAPVENWLQQLGISPERYLHQATLDPATLNATANKLLQAIPEESRNTATDWSELMTWLPLVKVQINGESVYANPSVPHASLGNHYCTSGPAVSRLQSTAPTPVLKLSLSMTRRQSPNKLETLLNGEWAIGDLVGRRIQLRFLPTQPVSDLLPMPLAQLRTVVPTFMVSGTDLNADEAATLGFRGDAHTIDGERITSENGDVSLDGRALKLASSDPALAREVEKINLKINASEYPRLRLEANLERADGSAVSGLPMSVFALQQDARPASAQLLRNMPEPPRISFALDFSTSLPEPHRGVGLAALVESVCQAVSERIPDASFRAGAFTGAPQSGVVKYFSGWSNSAEIIAESIRTEGPSAPETSTYFQALAGVTNEDANLVVLITDADGSDSDRPSYSAQISAGCPAVIINVPSALTRKEHFERLAELSGGHLFSVHSVDNATERIVDLASAQNSNPYVFDLVGDSSLSGEVEVKLSIPAANKSAIVVYEKPERDIPAARAMTGLFLTLELGRKKITRRLAGFPQVSQALTPLTEEHIEATRLALLGKFDLSVEASAPTAAAALDDIISSHLSCEALVKAAESRDEDTIVAATQSGIEQLPEKWLALNTPLPGAVQQDQFSFQAGYRMILYSNLPQVAGHYQRKVDILPFSDWHTITRNGDDFSANLKHSLQMSMLEAENFATSTMSVVTDADYNFRQSFQMNAWAANIDDPEEKRDWQIAIADRGQPRTSLDLLLPADPSRKSYWEVNTDSGAVLGTLMDSSGGATVEDTNRKFELLSQVIDAYSEVMEALVATPPAFAVWVELEKAKLEHLKRASIAIILMDGTHTSGYGDLLAEQIEGWITDKIRGTIDDGLGEVIGGYSEVTDAIGWHDRAQALWNAIRGGS